MSSPHALSAEEEKAIRDLRALAKRWPATLTLFSANGSLLVVHTADRQGGALCADRVIQVDGISNDGGDPDYYDAEPDDEVWDA